MPSVRRHGLIIQVVYSGERIAEIPVVPAVGTFYNRLPITEKIQSEA